MSDNKKYYYLRLKENFFDSDEMVILESMPDGYLYTNILLKLYLRSLKNEGRLMFNDRIPFNPQMLSTITRQPVGVIEKALNIFQELKLIEILDNGAIYMLDIQNFIGKTTTEADRQREYQAKIFKEKNLVRNLTGNLREISEKSTPEIEIEKSNRRERVIEENEDIVEQDFIFPDYLSEKSIESVKKGNTENYEFRIPIAYLNQKANRNYKFIEKSTKLVKARFNEGFTLDDFKHVIEVKTDEWINDNNMSKYLRPETLFGTKFEGYLNQKNTKKKTDWSDPNFDPFA